MGHGVVARRVGIFRRSGKPAHRNKGGGIVALPDKAAQPIAVGSSYYDGLVAAVSKQIRVATAILQQRGDDRELNPAIRPSLSQAAHRAAAIPGQCVGDLRQRLLAQMIIDGPAVVGVDQVQIPQLAALIEFRHTGQGQLEHRLNQAVADLCCLTKWLDDDTTRPNEIR